MHPREQLAAFITAKRHSRQARHSTLELGTSGQRPHFTQQRHGLTTEQCREANRLLRQREREQPLRGNPQQVHFRYACRCAGILSAIRRDLVGASRWGKRMLATKGGNATKAHALGHLRSYAPIARLAALLARERKIAAQYYETHGEPLPLGASPTETVEQQRLRALNDAWEAAEWQKQHDRLTW